MYNCHNLSKFSLIKLLCQLDKALNSGQKIDNLTCNYMNNVRIMYNNLVFFIFYIPNDYVILFLNAL